MLPFRRRRGGSANGTTRRRRLLFLTARRGWTARLHIGCGGRQWPRNPHNFFIAGGLFTAAAAAAGKAAIPVLRQVGRSGRRLQLLVAFVGLLFLGLFLLGGGGGCRRGCAGGAGSEEREEDREQEESVQRSKGDYQEDHLEEGDEDVGGRNDEPDDPEDGGDGALDDGQAEAVQTVLHALIRAALAIQVVVGDVRGKVHREAENVRRTIRGDGNQ